MLPMYQLCFSTYEYEIALSTRLEDWETGYEVGVWAEKSPSNGTSTTYLF